MESYKQEFIDFMVESHVLKFGEFTLKSGRKSPFFMNAGAYVTGSQLKRLGEYYAKAIHDKYGDDFDVLFGPAYKGIPLGELFKSGNLGDLKAKIQKIWDDKELCQKYSENCKDISFDTIDEYYEKIMKVYQEN